MLDRIERLDAAAVALGTSLEGLAAARRLGRASARIPRLSDEARRLLQETNLARYRYGKDWAARLEAAARRSGRIICISPHEASEAVRLLGVPDELIEVIPNGVDTELFTRATLTREERLGLLRRWLVDEPQGWDESGRPGSIRYPPEALEAFTGPGGEPLPLLLFVGRYLDFKRVPLLVRAYARARPRFDTPVPLLIWGGSPGEWEGEHPHTVAQELGVDGVFFSGWRGHDELPLGLSTADVFVAPSVEEPFGLVFLEAMSCHLPVITTRTGGPLSFVNTVAGKPNGWLVEPDDVDALADALVEAVNDGATRNERADNARHQARSSYSWRALSGRYEAVYDDVLDRASGRPWRARSGRQASASSPAVVRRRRARSPEERLKPVTGRQRGSPGKRARSGWMLSTHASWRWARNISHVQSVVGSSTRSGKRTPSRWSSSCCIVPALRPPKRSTCSLPVRVEVGHLDLGVSREQAAEVGDAETALVARVRLVADGRTTGLTRTRQAEAWLVRVARVVADLDRKDPQRDVDLRRRETGAVRGAHRLDEVVADPVQLGGAELVGASPRGRVRAASGGRSGRSGGRSRLRP